MAEEIKTNVAIDALAVAYLPDSRKIPFLCHLDTATISAAEKGIHGIARSEDVGRDKCMVCPSVASDTSWAMANTVAVMYPACLWNPGAPGLDGIRAHRSS